IALGLSDPADPASVEAELFSAVLDNPGLDALSFTRARMLGFDENGEMLVAPEGRFQVAVYRETEGPETALRTRWVRAERGIYVQDERQRPRGGGLRAAPFKRSDVSFVPDPTVHRSFRTAAARPNFGSGRTVWSDLSYLEADAHLPERRRRVVLTAMRALR